MSGSWTIGLELDFEARTDSELSGRMYLFFLIYSFYTRGPRYQPLSIPRILKTCRGLEDGIIHGICVALCVNVRGAGSIAKFIRRLHPYIRSIVLNFWRDSFSIVDKTAVLAI